MTDEQWTVLQPQAREVMKELVIAEGRPMVHDLRAVCERGQPATTGARTTSAPAVPVG